YCTAAGAIRLNVYSSIPNGTLTSPAVGTSNGGPITLNYQYKILDYAGTTTSDATAANFGYFRVQYAASLDGPWTTVQTVGTQAPGGVGEAHTPSQSCTPKTVNFLPAAGPMYIRFEITRTNGDWVIYFDDIEMTQGTPPPMCTTPDDVTSLNLTSTSTTVTGTFTSNGDVSGFLVIRSTDIILSTLPTDGFVYGVGNEVGGGVVVANTTDTSFSDSTVSSNTTYYYHVFAYNNHPDNDCLAAYSIFSATQNTTTCPSTPIIVGASNVRTSDAVLNWTPG